MLMQSVLYVLSAYFGRGLCRLNNFCLQNTKFLQNKKAEAPRKFKEFQPTKKHETGFEPATLALARRYSTTEPLVHK